MCLDVTGSRLREITHVPVYMHVGIESVIEDSGIHKHSCNILGKMYIVFCKRVLNVQLGRMMAC